VSWWYGFVGCFMMLLGLIALRGIKGRLGCIVGGGGECECHPHSMPSAISPKFEIEFLWVYSCS